MTISQIYSRRRPEQRIRTSSVKAMMIQTPVSGCRKISTSGGRAIRAICRRRCISSWMVGLVCVFQYLASISETMTIRTILMNSLGWNPRPPRRNQENAPLIQGEKGSE